MVRDPHDQPENEDETDDVDQGKAAKRSRFKRVFRNLEHKNQAEYR
jgi:hypothetical protein